LFFGPHIEFNSGFNYHKEKIDGKIIPLEPIDTWNELSEQSEGWSMKGYY